jgi:tetratricopeptide (TPR) repeat protein
LALKPDTSATLDSRGLALIRLTRYVDAIAAYDAALAKRPDYASSLYGRGLAKLKAGVSGAQDDLAAARKLDPKIDASFAEMGLKADTGLPS